MSLDILNMLIESACADGTPLEDDKVLLRKKASELGINVEELEKMIAAKVRGENYTPKIGNSTSETSVPVEKVQLKREENIKTVPIPEERKEVKVSVKEDKIEEEEILIPGILKDSVHEPVIKKEEPIKVEVKNTVPPVIPKQEIREPEKITPVKEAEAKVVEKVIPPTFEPSKVDIGKQTVKQNPRTETSSQTPNSKSKLVPIIIIIAVVLIGVGGFLLKDKLFGNSDQTTEITDDTQNNGNNADDSSKYDEFMKKGNDAFGHQNFLEAKENYQEALKYKAGDSEATNMKNKMELIISLQNEANDLFNKKNVARAKLRFDSLLTIAPDISDAIDKQKQCVTIIDNAKKLTPEKDSKGNFGFSESDGYIVVDYIFNDAKNFQRGVAPVQNSVGKWGFISPEYNKTYKLLIDHKFDKVWLDRGKYQASIEGESGYIYDISFVNGKLLESKY